MYTFIPSTGGSWGRYWVIWPKMYASAWYLVVHLRDHGHVELALFPELHFLVEVADDLGLIHHLEQPQLLQLLDKGFGDHSHGLLVAAPLIEGHHDHSPQARGVQDGRPEALDDAHGLGAARRDGQVQPRAPGHRERKQSDCGEARTAV